MRQLMLQTQNEKYEKKTFDLFYFRQLFSLLPPKLLIVLSFVGYSSVDRFMAEHHYLSRYKPPENVGGGGCWDATNIEIQ